jgi:hypothetical protein
MQCESTIAKGRYRCDLYIVHHGEHHTKVDDGSVYWKDEEED